MTDRTIRINWAEVSFATSYQVFHKLPTSEDWIEHAHMHTVEVSTFMLDELVASTTYDVGVTAINIAGSSPMTHSIMTTSAAPTTSASRPSTPTLQHTTDTTVTISWT